MSQERSKKSDEDQFPKAGSAHKLDSVELETELIAYLRKYGNTKESDLITVGTCCFNQSAEDVKKVLKNMLIEGYVERIIHDKLGENTAYFTQGKVAEFSLQIESDVMGKAIEETRLIL